MENFEKGPIPIGRSLEFNVSLYNSNLSSILKSQITPVIFFNSWYIAGIIKINQNFVGSTLFVLTIIISILLYRINHSYNVEKNTHLSKIIQFDQNSLYEWAAIFGSDKTAENEWCKKYNPLDENFREGKIGIKHHMEQLAEFRIKFNRWLTILTIVFGGAILNQFHFDNPEFWQWYSSHYNLSSTENSELFAGGNINLVP